MYLVIYLNMISTFLFPDSKWGKSTPTKLLHCPKVWVVASKLASSPSKDPAANLRKASGIWPWTFTWSIARRLWSKSGSAQRKRSPPCAPFARTSKTWWRVSWFSLLLLELGTLCKAMISIFPCRVCKCNYSDMMLLSFWRSQWTQSVMFSKKQSNQTINLEFLERNGEDKLIFGLYFTGWTPQFHLE